MGCVASLTMDCRTLARTLPRRDRNPSSLILSGPVIGRDELDEPNNPSLSGPVIGREVFLTAGPREPLTALDKLPRVVLALLLFDSGGPSGHPSEP
mmetsp:Transcript_84925/g.259323  ORF Transcript_84925/g.259323 Transcript_84925/m.259323 type:complete len:96 (+) Transcript_84925:1906-2193(+)